MAFFLVLQANHSFYEVGIFSNQNCLSMHQEDKRFASKNLIPTIQSLLQKNNLSLAEISAIGINQGPGPFTSLRIAVTTANGLSFASGILLSGHNSLEALLCEYTNQNYAVTIALLNAYNNDLYYGIQTHEGLEIGCMNHETLFANLLKRFAKTPLCFIGNGTALYRAKIISLFSEAFLPDPLPQECSLQQLAFMTFQDYSKQHNLKTSILPYYLKDIAYKTQI